MVWIFCPFVSGTSNFEQFYLGLPPPIEFPDGPCISVSHFAYAKCCCPSLKSGLLCACTRTKPIRMECARCSEFMFSVNWLVIWVHFWINLHQAICINLLWFFQVQRKQLRDFSRFKKPIPWATQILVSCPQSIAVHSWLLSVLWSRMSFQDARWISLISLGSVGCAGVTRKTSLNIMEDIGRS